MAPRLSLVPKDAVANAITLIVSEDEFSVKISHGDDRRFWLRVARECERLPPGIDRGRDDLIVTDLKRSEASDAAVVEALVMATHAVSGPMAAPPVRILYLDVAPAVSGDADGAKAEAAHLARISVRFAAQLGRRVADARLIARAGKHDFECVLEPSARPIEA